MQKGFAFAKLADRLTSIAELSAEDLKLLTKMPWTIGHFASHERVLRKSDRPSRCCLLLQGYLCWKDDYDGQITSIYVPGDVPDIHAITAPRLEAHLTALGPVVVAFVPHAFFQQISSVSPNPCRALQLAAQIDSACLRHWLINLGSRDSLARVAHLMCEITARLRAVGLAKEYQFSSPFTQSDLASACAISAVHANRIIQELRRRQLLQWQSRTIRVSDWQALSRLAGFEPNYLGLRDLSPGRNQMQRPVSTTERPELAISRWN